MKVLMADLLEAVHIKGILGPIKGCDTPLYDFSGHLDKYAGKRVLYTVLRNYSLFTDGEVGDKAPNLIHLNLSDNNLTNHDIISLISAVQEGQAPIALLDLSNNQIEDTAAYAILNAIEKNKTLLSINLGEPKDITDTNLIKQIKDLAEQRMAQAKQAIIECSLDITNGSMPDEITFKRALKFAKLMLQTSGLSSKLYDACRIIMEQKNPHISHEAEPFASEEKLLDKSGNTQDPKNLAMEALMRSLLEDITEQKRTPLSEKRVDGNTVREIRAYDISSKAALSVLAVILYHYPKITVSNEVSLTSLTISFSYKVDYLNTLNITHVLLQPHFSALTTLNILDTTRKVNIDFIILSTALFHLPSLAKLNIRAIGIGSQGSSVIARVLENKKTLTALNLSNNDINDSGVFTLAKTLESNKSLIELYLDQNNITSEGAIRLHTVLCVNKTLETLSLGRNVIGAHGITTLSSALLINNTLRKLILSKNYIGNVGATALTLALQNNKSLKCLVINSSNIKDRGTAELMSALCFNTTLEKLSMWGNSMGINASRNLAVLLKTNTSLKNLNLKSCSMDSVSTTMIMQALEWNTSIKDIDISGNKISSDGVTVLSNALEKNYTITSVDEIYTEAKVPQELCSEIHSRLLRNRMIAQVNKGVEWIKTGANGSLKVLYTAQTSARWLMRNATLDRVSKIYKDCESVIARYGMATAGIASKSLGQGEHQPIGLLPRLPSELICAIFSYIDCPPKLDQRKEWALKENDEAYEKDCLISI